MEQFNDRFEVIDALHRFAVGMDTEDPSLLASAFACDVFIDFTPAARKVGMEFPILEGRDAVLNALQQIWANFVTSHSVSNARPEVDEDSARLYALVEAQHVPKADVDRHFLMKNAYRAELDRQGDAWVIKRLVVDNLWSQGDAAIMKGD